MRIVIAGAHGQVARRLGRLLSARGDSVVGIIRNPTHAADLTADGVEPALMDLESAPVADVVAAVAGADAVVFAAGAGPGSGAERKRTVDYAAAVKLIEAAQAAGVRRYLMVSSIGADDPSAGSEQMRPYLQAKADADAALAASGLDFTIVRPGRLTNEPGTRRVAVGERLERADVTRDDVAAVLVAALDEPRTVGRTFVLVNGDLPIAQALSQL
jgi:uncharacterized protein YbjT (DUF2867 family)